MKANGPPAGIQFMAAQITSVLVELASAFDQIRAQAAAHVEKDRRIAELEAEVAKLKEP